MLRFSLFGVDKAGELLLGFGSCPRSVCCGYVLLQSTATARAAQASRILASLTLPIRWVRDPIEILSTESRFATQVLGTGSSPASNSTSLSKPRMVVVQGATSVRLSRGITTSRDSTKTGRRPISGSSHHQISPRTGSWVTMPRLPRETKPDRPTRRPGQWAMCHTPHK